MFKAGIFDLDGTLIDTIGDIAAAMNSALVSLGKQPRSESEYRTLVGWGMHALARRVLPTDERDEGCVEICYERALAAYAASPAARSRAYPGVRDLLAALASREIECAVLSNKPDSLVAPIVEAVLPGIRFRVLRGALPGVPNKPDPTSALRIAAELGVANDEILYLGDSEIDIRTAHAAGFFAAGAAWGFRGREELILAGADLVLETPLELLSVL